MIRDKKSISVLKGFVTRLPFPFVLRFKFACVICVLLKLMFALLAFFYINENFSFLYNFKTFQYIQIALWKYRSNAKLRLYKIRHSTILTRQSYISNYIHQFQFSTQIFGLTKGLQLEINSCCFSCIKRFFNELLLLQAI